jgi:hypothetical protein
MINNHIETHDQPEAITITSTDATRHLHEMHARGKMVIALAQSLAEFDGTEGKPVDHWIRQARKMAEA